MAYTKQTWATGDVITAEKLNHMEDGVAENAAARHTHGNGDVLDAITGIVTADNVNSPGSTSDLVDYSAFQAGAFQILAQIPASLKNPQKLTFTGAVSAEYDGSEAVSVDIPSGGSGGTAVTVDDALSDTSTNPVQNKVIAAALEGIGNKLRLLRTVTLTEETQKCVIDTDEDGNAFALYEWLIVNAALLPNSDAASSLFFKVSAKSASGNSYPHSQMTGGVPASGQRNIQLVQKLFQMSDGGAAQTVLYATNTNTLLKPDSGYGFGLVDGLAYPVTSIQINAWGNAGVGTVYKVWGC